MTPIKFKESNIVMGAGKNPNTGDLPAVIAFDQESQRNMVVSCWQLDTEEMQRIKETGKLWVCIMGVRMPPIMPTVYNPFTEHGMKIFGTG